MCPQVYQVSEIARPAYYDRQGIPQIQYYNAVLAPHGLTTRWAYTPAFRYAAFVEVIMILMTRQAASAPASLAACQVNLLPYFGGSTIVAEIDSLNNVPGAKVSMQVTSLGYMAYGDTLQAQTFNFDTGGTWQFLMSEKGTEFVY